MNNARQGGAPQMPPMRGPGGRGGGGGPMGARLNAEKPKDMLKTLGRLLKYIGKSKLLVITLVIIMALVTLSDLAGPAFQGEAINAIYINDAGKIAVDFGNSFEKSRFSCSRIATNTDFIHANRLLNCLLMVFEKRINRLIASRISPKIR